MLRDCMGTASSTKLVEALNGAVKVVLLVMPSSSSSSQSANASFSGTLPSCGERTEPGLRMLSIELWRAGVRTPEPSTSPTPRSFRSCACRSSSATAPSTVKSRSALKRLRLRTTTSTKRRFAALRQHDHIHAHLRTRDAAAKGAENMKNMDKERLISRGPPESRAP